MQWGFNAWSAKPLFQSGAKVGTASVQMGSDSEVSLVAPRNLAVTVPAGLAGGATSLKIRYQGPVAAPIAKGQHIADLVITTGDTPPQVVPLVAGEGVGRAGFFGRIWLGLKSLFGMA
jgi:D-alanyl-D-alanine carboxypeptidase (penicillin-binding protein 5/6)